MTLAEHSPAGSSVITVTATDQDSGENGKVTYRVVSTKDLFYIDPSNGMCFLFVFHHKLQNCVCFCELDIYLIQYHTSFKFNTYIFVFIQAPCS